MNMDKKRDGKVMRYLPSDKYNVAWFKLAECVLRGEKERALGVYRLLSHSFDDVAFASQLEGDILFSFEDQVGALAKYNQAIVAYQKTNRLLEAAAVCEHVITLAPATHEYIRLLIDIYKKLKLTDRVITYLQMLFALSLGYEDMVTARSILEELDEYASVEVTVAHRQEFIFMYLRDTSAELDPLYPHLERALNGFIGLGDKDRLQQFLTRLELASVLCFDYAHTYLATVV